MYPQLPGQSSFHHSGNTKKLGAGCEQSEEQAPQEKKICLLNAVAWPMIWDYPVSGISPCVDMSMLSQEWIVCRCLGKLLCSVCALNTCKTAKLCFRLPPFTWRPVIAASHSTGFCCSHPYPHRAIQKWQKSINSLMKMFTMTLNVRQCMHINLMSLPDSS